MHQRVLIVGQSESGKSFLGQWLCRLHFGHRRTMVLDPLKDPKWGRTSGSHWVTDDVDAFAAMVFRVRAALVFIDECGETVGATPSAEVKRIVTQGRHQGHDIYLLGQRMVQVARTMRDQCNSLYCFNVNRKDAEELALDFNDDALLRAPELRPRHYIFKRRHEPAQFRLPLRLDNPARQS